MTIRVKDALKIGDFTKCTILSGASGLNKPISFVGAMEVPDIAPWLTKDQLLVTTGYSIRANPQVIPQLIKDLHKASSAGLAIKTRFIGSIPKEAIELSDKLGIPLIEIPDNTAFIELINPLMQAISDDQKETAFIEQKKLLENHFFIDLITENVKTEEEAAYRARNLNWPNLPLQLVSFDIDKFENLIHVYNEFSLHGIKENITFIIEEITKQEGLKGIIIQKSDSFTCLYPASYSKESTLQFIKKVKYQVNKNLKIKLSAGASNKTYGLLDLGKSYNDTRDAITISKIENKSDTSPFIDDLLLEQGFLNMGDNIFFKDYVNKTIGAIEEYDLKNGTELLNTLCQLIDTLGIKAKAAENLFLHRNTLTYRIKKIEAMIDCQLSNPNELLKLAFAIKIKPYFQKQK